MIMDSCRAEQDYVPRTTVIAKQRKQDKPIISRQQRLSSIRQLPNGEESRSKTTIRHFINGTTYIRIALF